MRLLFALALVAFVAATATAAEWGGIVPGKTTMDAVRARYGQPSRVVKQKVEGYDSIQWVYEAAQAPSGMNRMVVDFGLLTPSGFRQETVRTFRLEPHPFIFTRNLIVDGWGPPSGEAPPDQPPAFYYASGLVVYFDRNGELAVSMVFTPPQPPKKD